ncbi:lysozyme inhibitor LprI family protein [Magnetospira sp. QH-2]|uniref:lysozyme inhibitor LprI family protein n=1 Tax=Magnetospira sp. (strain QH-2) TaxID=1288970 RepID=UPI0003E81B31|nr:lysozyme inhibitor LprI family protein [Magnetospira sp. QH-2]CCQ73442.1 Exported protein of unknown function [Magnetospira sp. QH-2]
MAPIKYQILLMFAILVFMTEGLARAADSCAESYAPVARLQCAMDQLSEAENTMEALWGRVIATSSEQERTYHRHAQAAWEAYREAHCLALIPAGGTEAGPSLAFCRLMQTERRIEDLRQAVSSPESP